MSSNIKSSCDSILNIVRDSCLHFCLNETPHSIYLTIRKRFLKSEFSPVEDSTKISDKNDANVSELRDTFQKKANAYEEEIAKLEVQTKAAIKQETVIQKLKDEQKKLETELEVSENSRKALNKVLKSKDKEIYDLKKENSSVKENFLQIKNQFMNYKSEASKEKKEMEKKVKKLEKKDANECLKPGFKVKCTKCEVETESLYALKCHERTMHEQSNFTQTDVVIVVDKKVQSYDSKVSDKNVQTTDNDEFPCNVGKKFNQYFCFYCDSDIQSESSLTEHRVKCHGRPTKYLQEKKSALPLPTSFPPLKFPQIFPFTNPHLIHIPECVHCGLQINCGTDLANHMKRVHKDYRSPFDVYKKVL